MKVSSLPGHNRSATAWKAHEGAAFACFGMDLMPQDND